MKHGADRPNIFYKNNEPTASLGAGNTKINSDRIRRLLSIPVVPVISDLMVMYHRLMNGADNIRLNGDVPSASLNTNNAGMIVQDLQTSIGAGNTEINADVPPASQGVGNSGISSDTIHRHL